jgi:hypothetical protein
VHYTSNVLRRFNAPGSFRIVKLLPSAGDELQYRIKKRHRAARTRREGKPTRSRNQSNSRSDLELRLLFQKIRPIWRRHSAPNQ